MYSSSKKSYLLLAIICLLQTPSFSADLIKFSTDKFSTEVVPVKSIHSFSYNKEHQFLSIKFYFQQGYIGSLYRARVDNLTEEAALKLIERIYDSNGPRIIEVNVISKKCL